MIHPEVKEALTKGFRQMVEESTIPTTLHTRILASFTKRYLALEAHIHGIAKGKDGMNGRDGYHGKDGVDGRHGRDGKDGKNGLDGRHGKDGRNGMDGKGADPKSIIEELKKLQGKDRLHIRHIDGIESILPTRGKKLDPKGIGGGGDTVAAGTNVTLSKDTHGRVVINATGSVANTFVYNEVLGGSGTAFTFAIAPIVGLYTIYGRGQKLIPGAGNDYTVSGANVTTIGTWAAGDLIADSQHA